MLGVVGLLIDADFLVATDPDLSSGNRCGDTDLLSDYMTHTQSHILKIISLFKENKTELLRFLPCSFFGIVDVNEKVADL